jgi:hypothetical protein
MFTKRDLIKYLESIPLPDDTIICSVNSVGRSSVIKYPEEIVTITTVIHNTESNQLIETTRMGARSTMAINVGTYQ